MFTWIARTVRSAFTKLSFHLSHLFAKNVIDEATLEELESLLFNADIGSALTEKLLSAVRNNVKNGAVSGKELRRCIYKELQATLVPADPVPNEPLVYLLVGINGAGKTTVAAKLAHYEQRAHHSVLLVAADTFRAAAMDQLQHWGIKLEIPVVTGTPNADPGSVVFSAAEVARKNKTHSVIIDTSGRLHTKIHLMKELEKIRKIIIREFPTHKIITLLVIDGLLGQSSVNQARLFHESTPLDGIVLTKLDGTGRAGAVFSIARELQIPIWFQSTGETVEEFEIFNQSAFLDAILS